MPDFPAHYYDGERAARHDVTVRLAPGRLKILGVPGEPVAVWPDEALRFAPSGPDDGAVRLTLATNDAARLIVADPSFRSALDRLCPGLSARTGVGGITWRRAGAWAAGVAAACIIVIATIQYLPALGARLIPQSLEDDLGRRARDQVLGLFAAIKKGGKAEICQGAQGRAALNGLMARLDAMDRSPVRFRVAVADIPIANAVALPGAHIVLFRGLFDEAGTPDGVAGILAHEMGHVIHRDPTTGIVRAIGLSLLFEFLTANMMGGRALSGLGSAIVGASYSREAEARADATAIEILDRAQVSTAGLAAFFERLSKKERNWVQALGVFASHPRSIERARAAARDDSTTTRPALTPKDWDALKGICVAR